MIGEFLRQNEMEDPGLADWYDGDLDPTPPRARDIQAVIRATRGARYLSIKEQFEDLVTQGFEPCAGVMIQSKTRSGTRC